MKIPEKLRSTNTRIDLGYAAIPTWKLVTYMVGIGQLLAGPLIIQGANSGVLNLVRTIIPGQYLDPQIYAYITGMCGLALIMRPAMKHAEWMTIPIAMWIASVAEYVYNLPPDNPSKNYIGLLFYITLYLVLLIAMTKDRDKLLFTGINGK